MDSASEQGGNLAGYIAVLSLWTRNVVWMGVIKGLAVMMTTLQEQFDTSTGLLGWMTSSIIVSAGIIGLSARFLGRRFGAGAVVTVCGSMIGGAFIIGALTTSIWQLALLLVVAAGAGMGISGVVIKEAVARCFTKNYGTAVGFAKTGYSIGQMAFAPLVQVLLFTYGWRGAMLIVGGLFMHFAICGAYMIKAVRGSGTNQYTEVPVDSNLDEEHQGDSKPSCITKTFRFIVENLDVLLLSDLRFWAVSSIMCFSTSIFDVWLIYFVVQAQSNGFSLKETADFILVGGVGSLVSKISQGFITDRGFLPYWILLSVSLIVMAASQFATPWMASYWSMMTVAFLVLTIDGLISCLSDVMAKEVIGMSYLAGFYAWIGVIDTILMFFFGALPGVLYDATGDFKPVFAFLGALQLLTMVPLILLKCFSCI